MPGYLIKTSTFRVGGRDFHMQSLLDAEQFHDPLGEAAGLGITADTWALFGQVWPAGEALAQTMATRDLTGLRVLEVGAGLCLASLVGHQRGGDMTASDIHPLIPTFLAENARLNGLPPMRYETCDWGGTEAFGEFDLIIGSDLLYDHDNQADLADFIDRHSASSVEVLLVDPDRQGQQTFHDEMAELGYGMNISHADCMLANGERFRGSYLHFSRGAVAP
ncbi:MULTISPECIES: class I SAM-dependent methyltransferase [Pseudomonas]|uniref:class I SAM-dependent methyltransferase n=2 Tax=Pseudomonas TaxID=286 RepID=UPI001BCD2CBF|nr:SAM-dependent methyltransferase [Pseudomonas tohonis]UXY55019.1 protein N-lysine methyltransferase family protein [Pseudomonas tohonis]BBP82582.1 methyltransferase type 12 [Pseudomonas sp. Pc102]